MVKATIPITDHDTSAGALNCTQYYMVEYRPSGIAGWTAVTPNPIDTPIVIENLVEDISYDVRITRVCCNGSASAYSEITFNATPS